MTTNSRVPSAPPGLGPTIGRRQFLTGTSARAGAAFTSNIDHQTIPGGIADFSNLYDVPWGDSAAPRGCPDQVRA